MAGVGAAVATRLRLGAWVANVATGACLLVLGGVRPAAAHVFDGESTAATAPRWLVAYVAVVAVVLTAVAVQARAAAALATRATSPATVGGTDRCARPVSSHEGRPHGWGRYAGLVVYLAATGTAFVGPDTYIGHVVPVAVLVVFWVGLPLAALVGGDVWRRVNPFDPIVAVVERVVGTRHDQLVEARRPPPAWTAPALLAALMWFLVAYHRPDSPRAVGVLLAAYGVVVVVGALRWGRSWLMAGEAFGAISSGIAALRRARLVPAAFAALAVVWLGGTLFGALRASVWWSEVVGARTGWRRTVVHTVGLGWATVVVAAVGLATNRFAARWTGTGPARPTAAVAGAVLSVAVGWSLAHDLPLLVFDGQLFVALVSDPVGRGWDLFGTVDRGTDSDLVNSPWVRWAQGLALVAGHAGAVVLAYRGAVSAGVGPRRAVAVGWVVAVPSAVGAVAAAHLVL